MNKEYVFQLTIEEFKELIKETIKEITITEPINQDTTIQDRYSYGLTGLAALLGCSKTTAWKIKNSGKIDKAIRQVGRKIIVDNEKALELLGRKNQK